MGPKGSQVRISGVFAVVLTSSRVGPLTFSVTLREQGDPGTAGDIGVKGDQVRGAEASLCVKILGSRC